MYAGGGRTASGDTASRPSIRRSRTARAGATSGLSSRRIAPTWKLDSSGWYVQHLVAGGNGAAGPASLASRIGQAWHVARGSRGMGEGRSSSIHRWNVGGSTGSLMILDDRIVSSGWVPGYDRRAR